MTPSRDEAPAATQEWGEVECKVDHRALIDKMLSRYPGKFTIFRELLQNADDARSSNAEICFGTAAYQQRVKENQVPPQLSDTKCTNVVQWTFRNDGDKFDEEGWKRLSSIAAGNPDPDKIGAFGVGFYSVFSVTDRPRVLSGGRGMEFYWKDNDNQLHANHGAISQRDHWTTFEMPLRESGPTLSALDPFKLDLLQFLASSITFMVHLTGVRVFFDNECVGNITKSLTPSETIDVHVKMGRSSPRSIMRVKEVQSCRITIKGEFRNVDSLSMKVPNSIDLAIFTAEVDITANNALSGLYRSLKKDPPSRLTYSLVYTGRHARGQDSVEQRNSKPEVEYIFQGLDANPEKAEHSHIFIGHTTGQTTGIGGHMASRFIPTGERESIDFADSYVSLWNEELLYVGGFLCRAVYERELSAIQHHWESAVTETSVSAKFSKSRDDLYQRFLHTLKYFAFYPSTPSPMVAQMLRKSFHECSDSPLPLLSSVGVRRAPDIRVFNPQVAKFLDSIPMLPEYVGLEAAIDGLLDPYKISPVTAEDVLRALDGHPLGIEKLTFCLQWWLELKQNNPNLRAAELRNAVTFGGAGRDPHSLAQMEYFIIDITGLGAHIPRDSPLPASVIPPSVSMRFTRAALISLGLRELPVVEWFKHISHGDVRIRDSKHDFTKSTDWAGRVLYTLSRAWHSLPDKDRHILKATLETTRCIPTSDGLRCPTESYLPIEHDDLSHRFGLPIVFITLDVDMRTLLSSIGAQTHIPLRLLLDQMVNTGKWSVTEFIRYLVQSSPLAAEDISMLRSRKLFSMECSGDDVSEKFCASELYPPVDIFRQLQLPVIRWDKRSKWSDESAEAELLYRLGLLCYPPLEDIIKHCASPNLSVGKVAFKYLCTNLRSKYSKYNAKDFCHVAFVPAESKQGAYLKPPGEIFMCAQWKAFGFFVVPSVYQKTNISELGIEQNPPPSRLLSLLEASPPSYEEASEWFECLSEYIKNFAPTDRAKLSQLKMVPTSSPNSREWLSPTKCYLGSPTNEFHSKLFVFVDFGTKANRFLSDCGSMKEPSVKDVAESLIQDPDRFYKLAGAHDGFLEVLRDLATRRAYIPNDTLHRMSLHRTLLGERREKASNQMGWKLVYELQTPREIVIADDPRDYELFGDAIYVAPRDELLEDFYSLIGCRRLSDVIHERYEDSPAVADIKRCSELQTLILERLDSFLKKYSQHQYDQKRNPRTHDFRVVVCERLLVHKTLTIGCDKTSREQDLWAATKCNENGSIELWLSHHVDQDNYDLAASLCRLLRNTVKDTDIFLLAATLSSDLKLLKRAGFAVDQSSAQISSVMNMTTDSGMTTDHLPHSTHGYVPRYIMDVCRAISGKLIPSGCPSTTCKYTRIPHQAIGRSYIHDIVNKATKACGSGSNGLLDDKDGIIQFLKQYSCNDFTQVENLRSLGITPQGVEVHVGGDIPDICAFIAGRQELVARFMRIIAPAATAYKLSMECLHIFYEVGRGPIAFNLKGNIYLSLRYFEEWHDEDVKEGNLLQAQSSWFFALAHEIAHNLIPSHDAAHEFWSLKICEAYMGDFIAATVSDV